MIVICDMLMDLVHRESRFHQMLQEIMRVKMSDQPRKLYLLSLFFVLQINPTNFVLKEGAIIIGGKLSTFFKLMFKHTLMVKGLWMMNHHSMSPLSAL